MTKFSRQPILIVLIVMSFVFSSCHITKGVDGVPGVSGKNGNEVPKQVKGNGNIVIQNRNIAESFEKIEVNKGINVFVTQSEKNDLTVETDENIQPVITTSVENGTLIITSNASFKTNENPIVRVNLSHISGLKSSSGSSIKSSNFLKSKALALESTSGSEMILDLETEFISIESSSGSTVKVNGKAMKLETTSSSGSSIIAGNLRANEVVSQTSSGSTTTVYPVESLIAKASSGSNIKYYNIPKQLEKSKNSGGNISNE